MREISSLRVRFRRISRAEGIQMLYYTEKILGLEKEKFNLQNKQCKSRLFGELKRGCLATTPYSTLKTIYHGQIPRCVHIPRIRGRFGFKSHAHVV